MYLLKKSLVKFWNSSESEVQIPPPGMKLGPGPDAPGPLRISALSDCSSACFGISFRDIRSGEVCRLIA